MFERETAQFFRLAAEPLHLDRGIVKHFYQQRPGYRKRFGDDPGQFARARLCPPFDRLACLPDAPGRRDEERKCRDRGERQPPVERDHERDGGQEHDAVLGDICERAADHVADALHIVEDVADGFARHLLRKKRKRHRVEPLVQGGAQVEHHLLADGFGAVLLRHPDKTRQQRSGYHAQAAQP